MLEESEYDFYGTIKEITHERCPEDRQKDYCLALNIVRRQQTIQIEISLRGKAIVL